MSQQSQQSQMDEGMADRTLPKSVNVLQVRPLPLGHVWCRPPLAHAPGRPSRPAC